MIYIRYEINNYVVWQVVSYSPFREKCNSTLTNGKMECVIFWVGGSSRIETRQPRQLSQLAPDSYRDDQ